MQRFMTGLRAWTVCGLMAPFMVTAQPGQIDPLFATGSGANALVRRVLPLADGKVLIAGNFTQYDGQPCGRIARLNADGSFDASYASGSGFDGLVLDMELTSTGAVVACGEFLSYDGVGLSGHVVRLNPDGTRDAGFSPPIFGASAINAVEVTTTDGVILTGSLGFSSPVMQSRVVKLLSTGAVDASFTTGPSPFSGAFLDVEQLSDDRLCVIGSFTSIQGSARNGICILQPDGALDAGFDPGAGTNTLIQDVAIDPSDRPIISGTFTSFDGSPAGRIARLNLDGSIDPSFDPGAGFDASVQYVLPLSSGGMLCAGLFATFDGSPMSRFCKLLGDGSADPGFTVANGANDAVAVAALRPDASILIGGLFTSYQSAARGRVARIEDCLPSTWYADADGDGFGDASTAQFICPPPSGFVSNPFDCDDSDGAIGGPQVYYIDLDDDGWGDASVSTLACDQPSGFTDNDLDCDDNDIEIGDATMYFRDLDVDGWGDPDEMVMSCEPIAGYVDDDSDCDDTDAAVGPPGMWSIDVDGDGHGANSGVVGPLCVAPPGFAPPGDCDDADPLLYPGAPCNDGDTLSGNDHYSFDGNCTCIGEQVKIPIRLMLEGPFDLSDGSMRDSLRTLGLLPLLEPYTALGYAPATGSKAQGSLAPSAVLEVSGANAVVDWVIAELRSATDPTQELTTRYLLLQADGDVIDLDGNDPKFPLPPADYHIAVLHRNHMGVITASPRTIGVSSIANAIDFTQGSLPVHGGADARVTLGSIHALRMGDVSFNDVLQYTGPGNDRDPILVLIGGGVPTNSVLGYHTQDTNMDGVVRYVGNGNDRDPILVGIGGLTPTNTRPNVYLRTTP